VIIVAVMDRNRSLRDSMVASGVWKGSGQLADEEVEADWIGSCAWRHET
jgi:hypothetical protein